MPFETPFVLRLTPDGRLIVGPLLCLRGFTAALPGCDYNCTQSLSALGDVCTGAEHINWWLLCSLQWVVTSETAIDGD